MGRINVTSSIFAGTSVPNICYASSKYSPASALRRIKRVSISLVLRPCRTTGLQHSCTSRPRCASNRWCYPKGCAAPGQVQCQCNTQGSLSKLKGAPPQAKINVTSKSPVGDISVVTLIRTDTTLDHSQKAEKV